MGQATYPIVTRTARVDIRGTLTGGFSVIQAQWSIYAQAPVSEDWSLTELSELALEVQDWFDDSYQAICSNQAVLSEVRATSLSVVNGATTSVFPALTGAVASELALSVGAPVVRCLVESGAPVQRSYFNPWGMTETQSHGNTLESAYQTALTTSTEDLRARIEAFAGSGWDPGLTAQPVVVSVFEPKDTPGYDPSEPYRSVGVTAQVLFMVPRQQVGRRVSRQE